MGRIVALLGIPLLSASAAMGQTYFSFSAGSDGFGFNVTNMPVYPAVPVPAVVRVPLLPGYDCGYDPGHSYHKYNKKQRKAYKIYRKAVEHAADAWEDMFMPYVYGVPVGVYYHDTDGGHHHHHKPKHERHHKKRGKKHGNHSRHHHD